jgi:hypothetical protein
MKALHVLLALVLLAAGGLAPAARAAAGEPEFSYMTLNGITALAIVADGIPAELVAYGLKPALFEERARQRLAAAGITSMSLEEARTTPGAARLRLRLVANKDGYGFYYFNLRADVRQKVPLGNPAGGFVSQVVWSDGESGTMQYNEHQKPLSAIDRLLDELIAALQAQNAR